MFQIPTSSIVPSIKYSLELPEPIHKSKLLADIDVSEELQVLSSAPLI